MLFVALGMALALGGLTQTLYRRPPAMVPIQQTESWWITRHEEIVARMRMGQVDLLLIGDSITQGWTDEGLRIWDSYYGRRRAVNLGFNSDRTEHVLWRMDHGEINGIAPKLAVLMIGTNNTGARKDPAKETAMGIRAILTTLRTRLPDAKVLLLSVFPRGASADDPLRQMNDAVNDLLHAYVDNEHVFLLNLNRFFLDEQGRLTQDLMPDYLHPNERGYQVWAEGMEGLIKTLMHE